MKEIKLSEIEGFYIGHAQDYDAVTGCTAIICPEGAVSGVDIRGGGPATRETALLDADKNTHKIHSVVPWPLPLIRLSSVISVLKLSAVRR